MVVSLEQVSVLRLRVEEYHVDGFRFDLASILCRGTKGEPLEAPPLIRVRLTLLCQDSGEQERPHALSVLWHY